MKSILKKIELCFFILFCFIFLSCGQSQSSKAFTAMNTFMTISLYSQSSKKGNEACSQIEKRIKEIENIISTTLPSSELYSINNRDINESGNHGTADYEGNYESNFDSYYPLQRKNEISELLDFSFFIYQKTDGAFNPALYPIIREWGFTTEKYKVPSQQRINELLLKTDFNKIKFDDEQILIPQGMELDFGAVGKGYAADEALLIMEKNGIKSALLDFGGNIQAVGSKPDGTLWRVGIKNPWENGVVCALKVASKAVVTSGGYERFFEDENGNRYIHIFDPASGSPCQSDLESVTIVCNSGKYADALSTSLFVMGKEKAVDWWKKMDAAEAFSKEQKEEYSSFDFIFITKDHKLIYSQGLKDSIEPLYPFTSIELVKVTR